MPSPEKLTYPIKDKPISLPDPKTAEVELQPYRNAAIIVDPPTLERINFLVKTVNSYHGYT